ncbi:outer membrane lipoprotein carrier protein LolA [Neolewinella aurantiaca]|uniref:Outer membrane lipoprotein carrier protein LolA n=1 Tax=Neolewinella aurantiaca TaxID=2602767 RepID=A0A5C7FJR1_9BACT|nr:outer membrane lipoprotein carrier protein LolA [Neolewinella aurantiaca]TXF85656.1 outer membrane lipoprotein carrier protein LolA [Neolewinella aurantiaca]
MRLIPSFLLFASLFVGTTLLAQESQYTKAQDSDPAAIALVSSLRTKYDAYKTMEADFRLDILLPGQKVESQQGKLKRQGDLVRFKLGDQEGIINSDAAYMIQHGNKEVMINNLPEPGEMTGMLTPQTLFSFYEGDNYILALLGKDVIDGKLLQTVEMKPVDRDNSDFTKLRLRIDQAKKELSTIEAFTRDGSRFTFHLDKTKGGIALSSKTFTFDKAEFPGYHVEDMRY